MIKVLDCIQHSNFHSNESGTIFDSMAKKTSALSGIGLADSRSRSELEVGVGVGVGVAVGANSRSLTCRVG